MCSVSMEKVGSNVNVPSALTARHNLFSTVQTAPVQRKARVKQQSSYPDRVQFLRHEENLASPDSISMTTSLGVSQQQSAAKHLSHADQARGAVATPGAGELGPGIEFDCFALA
jgi:hypothetical protein